MNINTQSQWLAVLTEAMENSSTETFELLDKTLADWMMDANEKAVLADLLDAAFRMTEELGSLEAENINS